MHIITIKLWMTKPLKTISLCAISLEISHWNVHCFTPVRCSWSIACRRCSNYIFIVDLTPGFNGLGKDARRGERGVAGRCQWILFDVAGHCQLTLLGVTDIATEHRLVSRTLPPNTAWCHGHCHRTLLGVTDIATEHRLVSRTLPLNTAWCHGHCHRTLLGVTDIATEHRLVSRTLPPNTAWCHGHCHRTLLGGMDIATEHCLVSRTLPPNTAWCRMTLPQNTARCCGTLPPNPAFASLLHWTRFKVAHSCHWTRSHISLSRQRILFCSLTLSLFHRRMLPKEPGRIHLLDSKIMRTCFLAISRPWCDARFPNFRCNLQCWHTMGIFLGS